MLSGLLQFKTYQQRRDAPLLQAVAREIKIRADGRVMIGCNRLVFSLLCIIRVIMNWTPTPRVPVVMSICRHCIIFVCISADPFVLCRIRPDQTRPDQIRSDQIKPGMTALRFPTLSLPNFWIYQRLPCRALGNIVLISLNKKALAGVQPNPPIIQKPNHSNHSQR